MKVGSRVASVASAGYWTHAMLLDVITSVVKGVGHHGRRCACAAAMHLPLGSESGQKRHTCVCSPQSSSKN